MNDIKIINELENEIFISTFTTINRLFEIDPDALTLYMFYCRCAKIQKTRSVYATNEFCMKGLGWGDQRFKRIKASLIDNNFIEIKQTRDKDGKLNKTYITVN